MAFGDSAAASYWYVHSKEVCDKLTEVVGRDSELKSLLQEGDPSEIT